MAILDHVEAEDRFDIPESLAFDATGFRELNITDETIMSILEGTAEELCLADYESLRDVTAKVIHKMYVVVDAICGSVPAPLTKRYNELWAEGVD